MELLRNPFFWVYLSGLAAGCSLGYLFRRLSKDKSGGTGFALFLSVSLTAFSSGIVISPDFLSAPVLLLLPFTGAVVIGFLIGRFPFALFPPVLLVFGALYLLVYLQIQNEPGIPVHEYPLRISVLRFTDTGSVLELSHRGKSQLIDIGGESFSIEGELISLTPYLPWPRREYLYTKGLVTEADEEVSLSEFQEDRSVLELSGAISHLVGDLGIWQRANLSKGFFNIHLLQSYTIDSIFFHSEEGY